VGGFGTALRRIHMLAVTGSRLPRPAWILVLATLLCGVGGKSGEGLAQTFSPFSSFSGLSDANLGSLELKICLVTGDYAISPSIIIAAGATPHMSNFDPYRRSAVRYITDVDSFRVVQVTVSEMRAVLDSLATDSTAASGSDVATRVISFSMYSPVNSGMGFESVLDYPHGVTFFAKLRIALTSNYKALGALNRFACQVQMMDLTLPDSTAPVHIDIGRVRLDHKKGYFVSHITLTNTGVSSIPGPISVVVEMTACCAEFINPTSETCNLSHYGDFYVDVDLLSSSVMVPNQSYTQLLMFENSDLDPIRFKLHTFTGAGGR
jgi:hypothetical protein